MSQDVRYDPDTCPGTYIEWLGSIIALKTILFQLIRLNHVDVRSSEVFTLFEIAQITVRHSAAVRRPSGGRPAAKD